MPDIQSINFLKPLSINNKIRLGPDHDGGYVVYEPALKNATLLTYGVGWDVGFEEHFNKMTSNKVLMFDPTMFNNIMIDMDKVQRLLHNFEVKKLMTYLLFISKFWLKKLILKYRNVMFVNEGLDVKKGAKYDTLIHHLQKYQLANDDILLKIDIEGKEYEIFEDENAFRYMQNASQILLEFHYLEKYFSRFEKIINRFKNDYEIVHIHGNNCSNRFALKTTNLSDKYILFPEVVELTFVKRNKIIDRDITIKNENYPIPGLDYPNQIGREDYSINFHDISAIVT
jgi:hypothetical protein